jgi:F0F1-type ATP synthase epsilon subunit
MMVLLGEGELRLRDGRSLHRFHVARGFLQVVENEVTVLAEEARPLEADDVPTTQAAH